MNYDAISSITMPVGKITPKGISLLGTAFIIKEGVLATAAHVVNNNDNGLVIVLNQINNLQEYQDTSNTKFRIVVAKIIAINPVFDVCLLKVDADVTSNLSIGSCSEINVCEEVEMFGYPHSDEGRMVLTYQSTKVGAKVLLNSSNISVRNLVLNIQTRPGQSGSPIFKAGTTKVVAMLIGAYVPTQSGGISLGGIDPRTLHQTSHAVSAEYIKEML